MSQRNYHSDVTQIMSGVNYPVTIVGAGASAPTISEGDPKGSYLVSARTGVGVYTLKTKDPFIGLVATGFQIVKATPAGAWNVCPSVPAQNADNTWTITYSVFNGAAAAELPVGDFIHAFITFRNSTVRP